jgi:hypothetical protein
VSRRPCDVRFGLLLRYLGSRPDDPLPCEMKGSIGHATPTAPASLSEITTTFGEVNRSLVPKQKVDLDAAQGMTSTD